MKKIFIAWMGYFLLLTSCKQPAPDPPVIPDPIGNWEQMADFPTPNRFVCIAFALDGKGYVGTGFPDLKDFYAFDPSANQWEQMADIPVGRSSAVGFSLNGTGYVLTGFDSTGKTLRDVWAYHPITDTWEQMADFPGVARHDAAGFVVGNKAYFGTGWREDFPGVQYQLQDWWEYDPATGVWTQKGNFPGGPCSLAAGIGLGTKGYLGLSGPGREPGKQWWAYDPATDAWTAKADFPGKPRYGVGIFALGDRIFAGNGTRGLGNDPNNYLYDWWVYDTSTDEWLPASPQTKTHFAGAGFAIGGSGYFGLGSNEEGAVNLDFWKFTPE